VAGPAFEIRVEDLSLAPSIQLLAYQIAREAIMNSLKYAEASNIAITFALKGDDVELTISDDGTGFDASAGEPEGHYGLTMMKERAQIAGGSLDLVSARGHGTIVTARFPSTWLNPERTALSDEPMTHHPQKSPLPPPARGGQGSTNHNDEQPEASSAESISGSETA
jgi:signal transduction histidine kinase